MLINFKYVLFIITTLIVIDSTVLQQILAIVKNIAIPPHHYTLGCSNYLLVFIIDQKQTVQVQY